MYDVSFPGLGLEFNVDPVAFTIGSRNIYWYGIIIACGFLLAVLYASFNSKRYNMVKDSLLNCVIIGLITAIVGARLYFVAFSWDQYKDNPISILYIDQGGLAIYGGLIGGLLGGLTCAKIQKLNVPACADLCAVGFLIGQGIGRWGNFTNQEAFGTETSLPWGMVSENTGGVPVHPCFLYESLWCLLGALLLYLFSRKRQRYYGQLGIMYLVWYGFERMIVEGLRTDSLYLPFEIFSARIRVSQALSFLMVLAGIVLLIIFRKKENFNQDKRPELNAAQESATPAGDDNAAADENIDKEREEEK